MRCGDNVEVAVGSGFSKAVERENILRKLDSEECENILRKLDSEECENILRKLDSEERENILPEA